MDLNEMGFIIAHHKYHLMFQEIFLDFNIKVGNFIEEIAYTFNSIEGYFQTKFSYIQSLQIL